MAILISWVDASNVPIGVTLARVVTYAETEARAQIMITEIIRNGGRVLDIADDDGFPHSELQKWFAAQMRKGVGAI